MTACDVVHRDGEWRLAGRGGAPDLVKFAGAPAVFQPGWTPLQANLGFLPTIFLDLRHRDGSEATWILDAGCEHRASRLADLQSATALALKAEMQPVVWALCRTILCDAQPCRPAALDRLRGLNAGMIDALLDLAVAPTRFVEQPGGDFVIVASDGSDLRLQAIDRTLSGNVQEDFIAAMSSGAIACASPVDGHMLFCRDSLVIGEHRNAYRFFDERHDLMFYVGTTHFHDAKSDLFIPAANIAFTSHAGDGAGLRRMLRSFVGHVVHEADTLLPYLLSTERRFAAVCRGVGSLHIGHHLWNELTGLDRIVARVPPRDLQLVIVPDANEGSEVFAPLDCIFPELAGRIDRTLARPRTLADFVYRNRLCVVRALDDHVGLALAARIRRAAAVSGPTAYDLSLAARLEDERQPVILLGVRVENRTAVDLQALLIDIIVHLRDRLGGVAIILDGHNARIGHDPASSFGSFGQMPGHEHPVFAELRLAWALQQHFSDPAVLVVNLFGASVPRSLFWAERCAFFVGFWGAGFAKYRWVCNRPGLALSNSWNLRHRGDLGIYHLPRYHEGGSELRFMDPGCIDDDASAPLLFAPTSPIPTYSNFSVDRACLIQELDMMIRSHAPSQDRSAPKRG